MSGNGHFLARVSGEVKGNVTLRKQQYRISDNTEQSIKLARNFITGKMCIRDRGAGVSRKVYRIISFSG